MTGRTLYSYERSLRRGGFPLVAGTDEAGRGACAGPLVAAAVILRPSTRIEGLDDSKALTARQRDQVYDRIVARSLAWTVVAVEPEECDHLGMHRANLAALRRAVVRLEVAPDFVISDGFAVDGLAVPTLAMWKGDQVAACVAAASVVAKVTRDRTMADLHQRYPDYGFDIHKGYCTALHQARLLAHGPSAIHRQCFENVRRTNKVEVL
ncbi:MAG: ribonuclease HII [Propionicimonas sp.]|uniref:ribonuclease HII n=1 Tax=Propionicimonas sp. TaxID=1955623 RepID=UPI002B1F8D7B|nr:ribonuclease HII [Propionicimonas sp.]MEA4943590.1 ribonuclease HII [Propionicimonas sp.]MEA5052392.1 ribonuclease HII [Propionicimonas sp.]